MKLHQTKNASVKGIRQSLLVWAVATNIFMGSSSLCSVALAQTSPITSSGLNTQVSGPISVTGGMTQVNITGGTRPNDGANLFHSFGEFGVPINNIANFLNETPLLTNNILGRVTGDNPSNIFGVIQTTGFANANLFLMNPAGIVFGPNATLNVSGTVTFTTADYLRLDEVGGVSAGIFRADPTQTSLLTNAPVAAFGFLGSNPGFVSVQGSQLTVADGQGISLVGGGITIEGATNVQPARLTAPGGQIDLASVISAGEVLVANLQPAPTMTLGSIILSQGSALDVSADSAGTIKIRGGQFVMDNASISADTINATGGPVAVDIRLTDNLSITADANPAITARSTGSGKAGEVRIRSSNLKAISSFEDFTFSQNLAIMDTHTSGSGKGGNVSITTTGDVIVTGGPLNQLFFIDSGTIGPAGGHGGDVTLTAKNVDIQHASVNTGDFVANLFGEEATGSGGNVTMTADTIRLTGSFTVTAGGDLSLSARDIQINEASALSASGIQQAGAIRITADQLVVDNSQFEVNNGGGPSAGITVAGKVIEFKNGSTIASQTFGDEPAGDITITATDHLTLSDDLTTDGALSRPTGLYSNSVGIAGTLGAAGSITVTTPLLEIANGARIDSTSRTSGSAGAVTIAAGQMTVTGERLSTPFGETQFFLGGLDLLSSGIYSRTVGSRFCSGACGDAGQVSITTGSLNLASGAQINSSTVNTGRGGDITVHATELIAIAETRKDGTPGGIFSQAIGTTLDAGSGGNIALSAGQSVTISNGASVSASSTGPGDTGNISINAGQQFDMRDSSITTEASQASGGNIDIQAIDRIRLVNSSISTSVLGGAGSGGNITIDPDVVFLQNSQVIAQAVQGAGGNITITTPLFLADSTSLGSASSQFGLNGTVTIQSPTSNLSGSLGTLSSKTSQAQSLLTQRCAALANGQASSFVVAGREQLPSDPGSWLTSPLALDLTGTGGGTLPEKGGRAAFDDDPARQTTVLSLRQIAPPGFLTQAFAVDWSASCQS